MSLVANKCLLCYEPLAGEAGEFHVKCCKKLFGNPNPPKIETTLKQIEALARDHAQARIAVAGVQPKLSIDIKPSSAVAQATSDENIARISVGLEGLYILKAPSKLFPQMVELEDLTMHLATFCKIKTAEHGLVRLASGELAYLTKRFDRKRIKKKIVKYRQEDLCQLSELLTQYKYHSSTEKVGKLIRKHSTNPGIDAITLLEVNAFSFLVGNADMHTKNFSMLTTPDSGQMMSPAYDLLATTFLVPEDREESALTINGKKAKLKRADFVALGAALEITPRAIEGSLDKFSKYETGIKSLIDRSFIAPDLKHRFKSLIEERLGRLAN